MKTTMIQQEKKTSQENDENYEHSQKALRIAIKNNNEQEIYHLTLTCAQLSFRNISQNSQINTKVTEECLALHEKLYSLPLFKDESYIKKFITDLRYIGLLLYSKKNFKLLIQLIKSINYSRLPSGTVGISYREFGKHLPDIMCAFIKLSFIFDFSRNSLNRDQANEILTLLQNNIINFKIYINQLEIVNYLNSAMLMNFVAIYINEIGHTIIGQSSIKPIRPLIETIAKLINIIKSKPSIDPKKHWDMITGANIAYLIKKLTFNRDKDELNEILACFKNVINHIDFDDKTEKKSLLIQIEALEKQNNSRSKEKDIINKLASSLQNVPNEGIYEVLSRQLIALQKDFIALPEYQAIANALFVKEKGLSLVKEEIYYYLAMCYGKVYFELDKLFLCNINFLYAIDHATKLNSLVRIYDARNLHTGASYHLMFEESPDNNNSYYDIALKSHKSMLDPKLTQYFNKENLYYQAAFHLRLTHLYFKETTIDLPIVYKELIKTHELIKHPRAKEKKDSILIHMQDVLLHIIYLIPQPPSSKLQHEIYILLKKITIEISQQLKLNLLKNQLDKSITQLEELIAHNPLTNKKANQPNPVTTTDPIQILESEVFSKEKWDLQKFEEFLNHWQETSNQIKSELRKQIYVKLLQFLKKQSDKPYLHKLLDKVSLIPPKEDGLVLRIHLFGYLALIDSQYQNQFTSHTKQRSTNQVSNKELQIFIDNINKKLDLLNKNKKRITVFKNKQPKNAQEMKDSKQHQPAPLMNEKINTLLSSPPFNLRIETKEDDYSLDSLIHYYNNSIDQARSIKNNYSSLKKALTQIEDHKITANQLLHEMKELYSLKAEKIAKSFSKKHHLSLESKLIPYSDIVEKKQQEAKSIAENSSATREEISSLAQNNQVLAMLAKMNPHILPTLTQIIELNDILHKKKKPDTRISINIRGSIPTAVFYAYLVCDNKTTIPKFTVGDADIIIETNDPKQLITDLLSLTTEELPWLTKVLLINETQYDPNDHAKEYPFCSIQILGSNLLIECKIPKKNKLLRQAVPDISSAELTLTPATNAPFIQITKGNYLYLVPQPQVLNAFIMELYGFAEHTELHSKFLRMILSALFKQHELETSHINLDIYEKTFFNENEKESKHFSFVLNNLMSKLVKSHINKNLQSLNSATFIVGFPAYHEVRFLLDFYIQKIWDTSTPFGYANLGKHRNYPLLIPYLNAFFIALLMNDPLYKKYKITNFMATAQDITNALLKELGENLRKSNESKEGKISYDINHKKCLLDSVNFCLFVQQICRKQLSSPTSSNQNATYLESAGLLRNQTHDHLQNNTSVKNARGLSAGSRN